MLERGPRLPQCLPASSTEPRMFWICSDLANFLAVFPLRRQGRQANQAHARACCIKAAPPRFPSDQRVATLSTIKNRTFAKRHESMHCTTCPLDWLPESWIGWQVIGMVARKLLGWAFANSPASCIGNARQYRVGRRFWFSGL